MSNRGMKRSTPTAKPVDTANWDTGAGQWLPDPEPAAPVPATPSAAPRRGTPEGLRRQTLDIPRDHYRTVHHNADALAETMNVTSKQINAQTVLRALVARYVNDEELRNSINKEIRKPYSPEASSK